MIDVETELDRLAADLAVLDVACGAVTRVNRRLEALAAVGAFDRVELHVASSVAVIRGQGEVYCRFETVLRINALRIDWIYVRPG